jgi:hypothetical protein
MAGFAFGKLSANMARARNIRDSTSHFHANLSGGFEPPLSLPCRAEKAVISGAGCRSRLWAGRAR